MLSIAFDFIKGCQGSHFLATKAERPKVTQNANTLTMCTLGLTVFVAFQHNLDF